MQLVNSPCPHWAQFLHLFTPEPLNGATGHGHAGPGDDTVLMSGARLSGDFTCTGGMGGWVGGWVGGSEAKRKFVYLKSTSSFGPLW